MFRRAFSLAELMVAMLVVSIGLLSIAGAVIYSTRIGTQSARQTRALQYSKQIIALSKLSNLPRVAPINDAPGDRVPMEAPPFQSQITASPDFKRNVRMQPLSNDPNDYRSQLYNVDVTVYWYDRGRELSLRDQAIHRSP